MSELLITLAAVLLVCAAWELYTRQRRMHGLRGGDDDPAARPPETAVPVESELVRRLYATRNWSETRALLSDDCVMVLSNGRRVRASVIDHRSVASMYEDSDPIVEAVLADLERPTVLYVRGRAFAAETWIRLVVTPCGTRIRELGPSSVASR